MNIEELVRYRLLDRRIFTEFFEMICTNEDNGKAISASRYGSHNSGARQEP